MDLHDQASEETNLNPDLVPNGIIRPPEKQKKSESYEEEWGQEKKKSKRDKHGS